MLPVAQPVVKTVVLRVLLTLLALPLPAIARDLHGSVSNTQALPVEGVAVSVNGRKASVDGRGRFRANLGDDDVFSIRLSAPGYYSMLHTYSRADFDHANGESIEVPPITLVARKPERRLLAFAGDTMMGRRFTTPRAGEKTLIRPGNALSDMQSVLHPVKPYLELADFASVNLETQLADTTPTNPLGKSIVFYTHPAAAEALRWSGVDYVALGNNHSYDFGDPGLLETLDILNKAGLAHSGAGLDDREARRPAVLDVDGASLALFSYVGWPGRFEPNQVAGSDKGGAAYGTERAIVEDMSGAPAGSLSVVQYHSGLEYVSEPGLTEETRLKLAVDNGADVAVGHHPHVIQGFEVYRGRLIAYSLGNFVFDQYIPSTHASVLLYAWYDGEHLFRAEAVPLHISDYTPTPASGAMRYDILQRLARLSRGSATCTERSGAHLVIRECRQPAAQQQDIRITAGESATGIHRLSDLGADAMPAVRSVQSEQAYRLGLDLIRRGDFEYHGLFGTGDRYWLTGPAANIVTRESQALEVSLRDGNAVSTGMKVFTRVFSRSAPASFAVRATSDGRACVRVELQRRPDGMGFEEALRNGPSTVLLEREIAAGSQTLEVDFQLPRTRTRGIRLLLDVRPCDKRSDSVTVLFDDLALIEWQTPWLAAGAPVSRPEHTQATHVQVQSRPSPARR